MMPTSPISKEARIVLVIDDDPRFQGELTAALIDKGIAVKNALDGKEGLRLAFELMPAAIVLDLILPKKTGLEVLRTLRRFPETKEIPVLVVSNVENNENIDLALRLGARAYLYKSNYDLAGIADRIQAVLEDTERKDHVSDIQPTP